MLISGGKLIAIDDIKTNSATLSGDGVWTNLGLNTSATIDPINAKITELSGNVDTISSNLNTVSGNLNTVSGNLIETSGKLDNEIQERKEAVSSLSSAIDKNTNNIETLSGDVEFISAKFDNEISAIKEELSAFGQDIETLSSDLNDEISARIENDDYLSAMIDTKQDKLSAGEFIDIDEYNTISVTGLKPVTYFAAQFNRHTSSEYFTFDGTALSASDKVGFFNLSIGYKVATSNACIDNFYYTTIKVNNNLVDTHYVNGGIPSENHYISKNVLNDATNNLYTFTIEKDNELNVSDMNITCIGFIGNADDISLGVLGANGGILTFGHTVLRV